MTDERTCRGCGCTDLRACPGGCYWVRPDFCSACADEQAQPLVDTALEWLDRKSGRASRKMAVKIGARAATIVFSRSGLELRDHLGVKVFSIDDEGYAIAPQYEPRELLPVFERAA